MKSYIEFCVMNIEYFSLKMTKNIIFIQSKLCTMRKCENVNLNVTKTDTIIFEF